VQIPEFYYDLDLIGECECTLITKQALSKDLAPKAVEKERVVIWVRFVSEAVVVLECCIGHRLQIMEGVKPLGSRLRFVKRVLYLH
jgi:hypothetical protein